MAGKHTESTPVRVTLRRHGRILCAVCKQLVTLDSETGRIPEHESKQLGVACPLAVQASALDHHPPIRKCEHR